MCDELGKTVILVLQINYTCVFTPIILRLQGWKDRCIRERTEVMTRETLSSICTWILRSCKSEGKPLTIYYDIEPYGLIYIKLSVLLCKGVVSHEKTVVPDVVCAVPADCCIGFAQESAPETVVIQALNGNRESTELTVPFLFTIPSALQF